MIMKSVAAILLFGLATGSVAAQGTAQLPGNSSFSVSGDFSGSASTTNAAGTEGKYSPDGFGNFTLEWCPLCQDYDVYSLGGEWMGWIEFTEQGEGKWSAIYYDFNLEYQGAGTWKKS